MDYLSVGLATTFTELSTAYSLHASPLHGSISAGFGPVKKRTEPAILEKAKEEITKQTKSKISR